MTTSVRLPEKIDKKLKELMKKTGKNKSKFIIDALNKYLFKKEKI